MDKPMRSQGTWAPAPPLLPACPTDSVADARPSSALTECPSAVREDPERCVDRFIKAPARDSLAAGTTMVVCLLIGRLAGLSFTAATIAAPSSARPRLHSSTGITSDRPRFLAGGRRQIAASATDYHGASRDTRRRRCLLLSPRLCSRRYLRVGGRPSTLHPPTCRSVSRAGRTAAARHRSTPLSARSRP